MDSVFFSSISHHANFKKVKIDQEDFLFELSTHPDPYSLLGLRDTLALLDIKTEAYRVDFSHFEDLPDGFLTLLNIDGEELLYSVQRKKNNSFEVVAEQRKATVTSDFLQSKWTGVVLQIVEGKTQNSNGPGALFQVGVFLLILSSLLILYLSGNYWYLGYCVTTLTGLLFSFYAFRESSGKPGALNKYCDGTRKFDCSIIKSKTKFFGKEISFTDLSIIYFSVQFILLVSLVAFEESAVLIAFQKFSIVVTGPVVLISIYYQLSNRKWCLICLGIVLVLVVQALYGLSLNLDTENISSTVILYSAVISFLVLLIYFHFRQSAKKQEDLSTKLMLSLKVVRLFDGFARRLCQYEPFQFPDERISIGSADAPLTISCITNPYCAGCQELHAIIHQLQERYPDMIKVDIYFKTNMSIETDEVVLFFQTLYSVYTHSGAEKFDIALVKWFELEDDVRWLKEFGDVPLNEQFSRYYDRVNQWSVDAGIDLTPVMFINGFLYPQEYDITFLPYFIDDLMQYEFPD